MPERDVQAVINELVRRANEGSRRLRMLEEKDTVFEMRMSGLQDTLLRNTNDTKIVFENMDEKLKELETRVLQIENQLTRFEKLLERFAKKSELKELESMLELFNPLKANFITKEETKRMIEERVR